MGTEAEDRQAVLVRHTELLDALEAILEGDAADDVVTPSGLTRPAILKAISDNFAQVRAVSEGMQPYETLDDAIAAGEPPLASNGLAKLVVVWNDPVAANNAVYGWDGVALAASVYDPQTAAKAAAGALQALFLESFDPDKYTRSKMAWAIIDKNRNIGLSQRLTGEIDAPGALDIVGKILSNQAGLAEINYLLDSIEVHRGRSGALWAVVDSAKKKALWLDKFADTWVKDGNLSAYLRADFQTQINDAVRNIDAIRQKTIGTSALVGYGDSLTHGSGTPNAGVYNYVKQLADLYYPPRSYSNKGIGGQVSGQIAARAGAREVKVTLNNNTVLAASASVVTNISLQLLSTPADTVTRSLAGSLHGIPGTLTRDSGNSYTFTAENITDDTLIPENIPFVVNTGSFKNWIYLIWAGTNDNKDDPQSIVDNIQKIVGNLEHRRFLVFSLICGATAISNSDAYNKIMDVNALMQSTFTNNYVDLHRDLVNRYDPENPQDLQDFANDVVPDSLRSDGIHLNATGYGVVAQTAKREIDTRGWTDDIS